MLFKQLLLWFGNDDQLKVAECLGIGVMGQGSEYRLNRTSFGDEFKRSKSFLKSKILGLITATLTMVISLASFSFVATPAHAGPFMCTGDVYQVQSGQLRIFDPVTSTYVNVGTNQGSYNATGYNVLDNYAYGSQSGWLIRIHADGTVERVHNLGFGSYSGDVDRSNNYWLRRNNTSYYKIDIATGAVTTVNFTGSGIAGVADVAYVQFGGKEYLVGYAGGGRQTLYNITDGTVATVSVPGLINAGGFGATWTDSAGRIFTFNNSTGQIYEVSDPFGSPTAVLRAVGVPSGNNDGFSCNQAPFPNLPPLAFDDDFVTPVNVPVSGNVIVDNGNGMDNDPEGTSISVQPGLISGPSNGSVTIDAAGNFTYTPDMWFVGTDTFVYEIVDASGLTAQATVTIEIKAIIDFKLTKKQVGGPNPITEPGQVIDYEIVVENTGEIPLTNVVVDDTLPDGSTGTLSGPVEAGGTNADAAAGNLDLDETWTYTISYTTTQADIDANTDLINTVTAETEETDEVKDATAETPVSYKPLFTMEKVVDLDTITAPGTLTYTITVENTGNVTLTNPDLTDVISAGPITSGPTLSGDNGNGELDVGETWTYTVTYDATQDDIDAGADIVNKASIGFDEAKPQDANAVTEIKQDPSFTLEKTVDQDTINATGVLAYQITVENTGNVSLTNPVITDVINQGGTTLTLTSGPTLSGDTDGDGEIDPDETWVYDATYAVTQGNIDDGAAIQNKVTFDVDEAISQDATVQTTIEQEPDFEIDKVVDQATITAPGTLTYTITVRNTGNTTLTGIAFGDAADQNGTSVPLASGPTLAGDTNNNGDMEVSETWVYTVTVDVTQAMIDDGNTIVNTAGFAADGVDTKESGAKTAITQTPKFTLDKSVDQATISAPGTLTYTITAENTGNVSLTDVVLTDSANQGPTTLTLASGPGAPSGDDGDNVFEVGETWTWTVTIAADQTHMDDGGDIINTATLTTDEAGSLTDTAKTVIDSQPNFTISKVVDVSELSAPGLLTYTVTIVNTGNVKLTNVVFSDAAAQGTTPVPVTVTAGPVGDDGNGDLDFGETWTYTVTANATQDHVDDGTVLINTATFDTTEAGPKSDTAETTFDQTPAFTIVKDVDTAALTAPGTLTYTITVTNTGNTTLTSPVLTDVVAQGAAAPTLTSGPVLSGDDGDMLVDVGEVWTYTATLDVTQAMLDTGSDIVNTASFVTDEVASQSDDATTTITLTPAMTLAKVVDIPTLSAPGTLTYTITATNTGNQTLTGVMLTDALDQNGTGATLTSGPTITANGNGDTSLDVGEVWTWTATFAALQSHVDDGNDLVNTASVTTDQTAQVDASDTTTFTQTPEITLVKDLASTSATTYAAVGDQITYEYTVTNSGNTTLGTPLNVTDDKISGPITCSATAVAPGDSVTCSAVWTAAQADIDAGSVTNVASASDGTTTSNTDTETVNAVQSPALGLVKTFNSGTFAVGSVLTYDYVVTNTGNTTITNAITVTDNKIPASGITCPAITNPPGLAPNASITCTGLYTVTAGDAALGVVTNIATASDGDATSNQASENVPTSADPALTLDKVEDPAGQSFAMVGDVLTYRFDVTNTGGAPFVDDIEIVDSKIGTITCYVPPSGMAFNPGDSISCTASYTVTLADMDAGEVLNEAYAQSTFAPDNPTLTTEVTSEPDDVTITGTQAPAIELTKDGPTTFTAAGETLTYTFTVENTGTVTLSGISVSDPLIPGLTCAIPDLAPDATGSCTGTYTVLQSDVDASSILNTATVVANPPLGGTVDDDDNHTATGPTEDPKIELTKTEVDGTGTFDALPTTEDYSISVENTGNVTLVNVTVSDPLIGLSCLLPDMAPGDVVTSCANGTPLTGTYTLTQADIDAGSRENTASVTAESTLGTSASDDDTVVLTGPSREPAISLDKETLFAGEYDAPGQVANFTYKVTNTGNITLTAPITVSDDKIASVTCPALPATGLAPGDFITCTGAYTISQTDIDNGSVTNTASAQVDQPISGQGTVTATSNEDDVTLTASQEPSLVIAKSVDTALLTAPGTLTYTITVENTGNQTLTNVSLADAASQSGAPVSLASGPGTPTGDDGNNALDVGETWTYTVTIAADQTHVDDGGNLVNVATVDTDQTDAQSDDAITMFTQSPNFTITKDVDLANIAAPGTLTYTISVENTGNTTLTGPVLSDAADQNGVSVPLASGPTLGADTGTVGAIDVGETWVYTATVAVTQAMIDAGTDIDNLATMTTDQVSAKSDDATTTITQTPSFSLTKDVDIADLSAPGTLTYTITAENTGNVTLTGVSLTDTAAQNGASIAIASGPTLSGDTDADDALDVGETWVWTVTINALQSHVDDGNDLVNTATVTTQEVPSQTDDATTTFTQTPAVVITKNVDIASLDAPGTLVYTISIENTGNVTLTNPVFTDTLAQGTTTPAMTNGPFRAGDNGNNLLDVGETWNYLATLSVTQDMIDNGADIVNTASIDTDQLPVQSDDATTTIAQNPDFTIEKSVDLASISAPGTLTYDIEIENTGNVTLTGVNFGDVAEQNSAAVALTTGPTGPTGDDGNGELDVGETWTYAVTIDADQANLDAGNTIDNTATFTTAEAGAKSDDASTVMTQNPAFTLLKTVDQASIDAPGTLTYTIRAENTGNVSLTNVVLADSAVQGASTVALASGPTVTGNGNGDSSFDVGEVWTWTVTIAADQTHMDDGGDIINTATLTTDEAGSLTDTAKTVIDSQPNFTISKVVDVSELSAPGLLTYTVTIVNTGNVKLTNVVFSDAAAQGTTPVPVTVTAGPVGDDGNGDLDFGETWTYTVTANATQDHVDDGTVLINTATFDTTEAGPKSDTAETTFDQTPAFTIVKDVDTAALTAPGTLTYTITVTNTGNTTLTSPVLTDVVAQGAAAPTLTSGPVLSGDDGDMLVDVGEVWTYTATLDVTQAMLDTGSDIVNTASFVTDEVASQSDDATTTITLTPAMTLAKVVDIPTLSAPGTLTYTITATNTGNQTLTGVMLTDALDQNGTGATLTSGPTITANGNGDTSLDVGEVWTWTATFAALQSHVDDGNDLVNTASVTTDQTAQVDASDTTTFTQTPEITLVKDLASTSATTYAAVGDQITYEYTVTNSGNTTLGTPLNVTDDKISGPITCSATAVAPGDSVTCSAVWTAAQADIDAGSVTNVASASDGTTTSNTDTETVNAVQSPALGLVKTFNSGTFAVGSVLTYDYVVTNTGNTTITNAITVTDNKIPASGITCPAITNPPGLAPNASITCTGLYTVTAGDAAIGSVLNVATASDGNVTSNADDEQIPTDAPRALSLTKTQNPAGQSFDSVGDVLTYEYSLTNTGAVPFVDTLTLVDDKIGSFACYTPPTGTAFNPGDTVTCTASYSVTQDDLDAGQVVNVAVANTTFAPDDPALTTEVYSNSDDETIVGDIMPNLGLIKAVTAGNDPAAVGDVLTYTLVATNTGNQTLSTVAISDPMLGALTCDIVAPVTLLPTEALTCTGTYTVLQTDIDAQILTNTANATGTDPDGDALTPDATDVHPLVDAAPAVQVVKAITPNPGTDPAYTNPGDVVNFVMTVTNTGNVTLNSVAVTDSLVPGTCTVGPLLPNATDATCTFAYTVTQADIDAGAITNTANAVGTPASDDDPVTDDDTIPVQGPPANPLLALEKSTTHADYATAGQVLTYDYKVTNAGNITLFSQISVTDDKIGTFNCGTMPSGGLAPGAFVTCSATYTVLQSDVDSGSLTNIATADNDETPVSNQDTVTLDAVRDSMIELVKTPSITSGAQVGDVITYTYTVTNSGNTTLTNVTMADTHTSASAISALPIAGDTLLTDNGISGDSADASANGVWDVLAPGDVVTFTATYTVTQRDVDRNNPLTNVATVTSTSPDGVNPDATDDASVQPEARDPDMVVTKSISSLEGVVAGDLVTFEITIENSGNVTLDNVVLTDTLTDLSGVGLTLASGPDYVSGDNPPTSILEVDETWVFEATYALTQSDIDAGGILNVIAVTADDPGGDTISDDDDAKLMINPDPSLNLEKTITSSTIALGETVTFELLVENTGNVTLSGVVIASDTLTRADGTVLALTSGPSWVSADAGSSVGVLIPNEVATYQATYILTQADIDAGGIQNTALAQGTPPTGTPVTDTSDDADDTDGNTDDDPTVLEIPADPSLALLKQLDPAGLASFDAVGDVIDYQFIVTNTGNVTLTNQIGITDPLITGAGGTITCPAPPLAPLASVTCTGSYTVTQADIDAGKVDNTATASDGTTTSNEDDVSVPAIQSPAMSLVKTPDPMEPEDYVTGAVATYTYVVTNTGNTTLTSPITVTDNLIPASDISCPAYPAAGLAPTETYTCTATYTITSTDVTLGSVTNIAGASDGTIDSNDTSATIPNQGTPSLTLDKQAVAGSTFANVGDVVDYTYTVTNSGQVAFTQDIRIFDNKIGDFRCWTALPGDPDFSAGETVTCTAQYTITQADVDAGEVINDAYAQTNFVGTEVSSNVDQVTVTGDQNPSIDLVKSAVPARFGFVDDVIEYTFDVENTGNQTLTGMVVTDPLIPSLSCTLPSMAPGDTHSCTGTFTITQVEIDAATLTNTASVTALDPNGDAVTDTDSVTLPGPANAPALELTKTANPSPFGAVGTVVTYMFAVENTGNVTLTNVAVTDPLITGFNCVIPSIAVGATDTTCSAPYTVTQADVDAASITNTASATGTSPDGSEATDDDSITTQGPEQVPALEATKTFVSSGTAVGSTVTYTLLVENTGNVTLTNVGVTDTMVTNTGGATALDGPFALISGDLNTDLKLDVDEVWTYTATYTLTQDDINAGGLINSVTVTAEDPNNEGVTDISDDGIDDDGNTSDDPTVYEIVPGPAINLVKTASVDPNAVAGDVVTFTFTGRNVGDIDLEDIMLTDTFTRVDGTPLSLTISGPTGDIDGDTWLDVLEVWTWTATHTLTQADIDAGGVLNSATIAGTDVLSGDEVSDVSDDNVPGDGNTTDDPAEVLFTPMPSLEATKTLTSSDIEVGDDIIFEIVVENTGNVTLLDVALADTMTNGDGDALVAPTLVFGSSSLGSVAGTLLPGETATYTVTYQTTQADVDSGSVSNSVVATGTSPLGAGVTDTSDDGDDTDGNTFDDPTVVPINPRPDVAITKSIVETVTLFPQVFATTFAIEVENTGNITLNNLRVQDDLTAFVAPATLMTTVYPATTSNTGFTDGSANSGYDGVNDIETLAGPVSLASGQTGTILVTATYFTLNGFPANSNVASVVSDEIPTPNSAAVSATMIDRDGDGAPDDAEGCGPNDDRDGDGVCDSQDYDPTGYFYCEEDGRILSGGLISVTGPAGTQTGVGVSNNINIVRDGSDGYFQFYVSAPGTYTLSLTYPPGGVPSTDRITSGNVDVTSLGAGSVSLGSSEFGSSGRLADFSAPTNTPFYTSFTVEAGDPIILNNNIPLRNCSGTPDILATKSVDKTSVVFGDTVTYTLTFTNNTSRPVDDATIIDRLPPGVLYTPGTAVVDGVADEPAISGQVLSWTPIDLAPAQTVTVRLSARIGANGNDGTLTNRTWMEDDGARVSNVATASVRMEPEHVFDCSDIIGKVFDDVNQNGYQDGPDTLRGITDQTYYGDKLARPKTVNKTEPGMAGVRLVTPNGLRVTTDEYGRFHVPCGALPKDIGSNFIMKLDTRSLPTGYRLTTENPRVIRVTPGKMAKLNFGVAISNIVDIDINHKAFISGRADIKPGFDKALNRVLRQIRSKPSMLRISYVLRKGEDTKGAQVRIRHLEKIIRRKWRGVGRYKLVIERTITRPN